MSKSDTVIDFYESQLNDLGLSVQGDGFVSFVNSDDVSKPVTINGKRLCLPTKVLLKEANWDQRLVFHPLSEQSTANASPVLNSLKNYIAASLTMKITAIAIALAEVAADVKRHKGLGAKASKFMQEMGEFDEKSVIILSKILCKIGDKPEERLVSILMKNGEEGTLRTTHITFPMIEAIDRLEASGSPTFMGLKLRVKDVAPIQFLFNYITGGEKVTAHSNDRTAPYYESLLKAWYEIAGQLNTIYTLFQSKVPAIKTIGGYSLEWGEKLDDWTNFASKHHVIAPPLPGNRPIVEDEDKNKDEKPVRRNPIEKVSDTAPWDDEDVHEKTKTVEEEERPSRGMTLEEIRRRRNNPVRNEESDIASSFRRSSERTRNRFSDRDYDRDDRSFTRKRLNEYRERDTDVPRRNFKDIIRDRNQNNGGGHGW